LSRRCHAVVFTLSRSTLLLGTGRAYRCGRHPASSQSSSAFLQPSLPRRIPPRQSPALVRCRPSRPSLALGSAPMEAFEKPHSRAPPFDPKSGLGRHIRDQPGHRGAALARLRIPAGNEADIRTRRQSPCSSTSISPICMPAVHKVVYVLRACGSYIPGFYPHSPWPHRWTLWVKSTCSLRDLLRRLRRPHAASLSVSLRPIYYLRYLRYLPTR
jgi:hypothetical protein